MVNSPVAVLELQCLGAQVTLIDRCDPGQETSSGNTGVIARSALMPFTLRKSLPALLRNKPTPAGRSERKPAPARQRVAVTLPQPGRRNLWLAYGHQHVGFSSSTAKLLGALMSGQPAPIDAPLPRQTLSLSRPAPNRAAAGRAAPGQRCRKDLSGSLRKTAVLNSSTTKKRLARRRFLRGEIPLSYPA